MSRPWGQEGYRGEKTRFQAIVGIVFERAQLYLVVQRGDQELRQARSRPEFPSQCGQRLGRGNLLTRAIWLI